METTEEDLPNRRNQGSTESPTDPKPHGPTPESRWFRKERIPVEETEDILQDDLPDRRRHGYKELEDKLERHAEELEERFSKSIKGALIAFAVIGLMSAAGLIGFGFILRELANQANEIQAQRRETVFRSCQEQNQRHDATIAEFRKIESAAIEKAPQREALIHQSVAASLRLVETLAPKRSCYKLVALSVKPDN